MSKKNNTKNIKDSQKKLHKKISTISKKPNDGSFIEYNPSDSFSPDKTTAYGEVQDVDDL